LYPYRSFTEEYLLRYNAFVLRCAEAYGIYLVKKYDWCYFFMYNLLLVWLYPKSEMASTLNPLSCRYFISPIKQINIYGRMLDPFRSNIRTTVLIVYVMIY
jgi:hypothetical protein